MSTGPLSTGPLSTGPVSTGSASAVRPEAAAAVVAATAAEPAPAIVTAGLTKRFRSGQLAVDGLDMLVPPGSVYGFLGPNGSGKTTTIRMLLGLVYPTQGSHALLGVPMPAGTVQVLPRVGSLVEGPAFYPQLSGWDNLARVDAADRTADPARRRHGSVRRWSGSACSPRRRSTTGPTPSA